MFLSADKLLQNTIIDLSRQSHDSMKEYVNKHMDNMQLIFPIMEGVCKRVQHEQHLFSNKQVDNTYYSYFKVLQNDEKKIYIYHEYHVEVVGMGVHSLVGGYITISDDKIKLNPIYEDYIKRFKGAKKKYADTFTMSAMILLESLIYIGVIYNNRNTIYKEVPRKLHSGGPSVVVNKAPRKLKVLNDDRVIYISSSDDNVINSHLGTRKINKCFNVTGHYRHYKSGLVVWINEYTKGQGTKTNKTYIIK